MADSKPADICCVVIAGFALAAEELNKFIPLGDDLRVLRPQVFGPIVECQLDVI